MKSTVLGTSNQCFRLHCGMKGNRTTTAALDWNVMLGLTTRLRTDQLYRDYLLILLGSFWGLRIGDLVLVRWIDVVGNDQLHIVEVKTKKRRVIYMNARVKEAIEFCLPRFQLQDGWRIDQSILSNRWGEPLSVSYVNKRLKWIFSRYRIKTQNRSSHTLRKTFGRRVWEMHGESDKALVFLSEIFSHSSTAITRKYLGITQEELGNAYLEL